MNINEAKKLARDGTPTHRAAWIQPFARLITGTPSKGKLTRVAHSGSGKPTNPEPKANTDEPVLLLALTDDEVAAADVPRWVPTQEDAEADDYQPWERPAEKQVVEVVETITAAQVESISASQMEGGNDAA